MKRIVYTLILFVLLSVSVQPVQAGWGDFFDENGNLKPGVVDLGQQKSTGGLDAGRSRLGAGLAL